jgi:tetratricopeptide (TPR) repeat protein
MPFQKAKTQQEAERSVAQGKISQAIRLYQLIIDNDPSDTSVLNTIGDLYIRDHNLTEGLKQFRKLAEAYTRDGFNVRAIAIYKKISKLDPNSADTLLKLGELYQLQGLTRESREQYLQAAEFLRKRNQGGRVLEVLRKVVQLEPDNVTFRNRLAAEYEQTGKEAEAAQVYLESAEVLLRRDGQAAAEVNLRRAAELDPKNSRVQMLRARLAIARNAPAEAEAIITSSPELRSDPASNGILFDAYLGADKLAEAKKLALQLFDGTPAQFAPLSTVAVLLARKGEAEEAYQLLAGVSEQMIVQKYAPPLVEALRRIWTIAPQHRPILELLRLACERSGDESALPEVLEALGRLYEEAGDLEKAEAAYLNLLERDPDNENYPALLAGVQQKLGRKGSPIEFPGEMLAEEEHTPEPVDIDATQRALVDEALENSDFFARYHLPEKAILELEKVVQLYPDQVALHRRILEISRKNFPGRAAAAAGQLARIFEECGDTEAADRYRAIAASINVTPAPPPAPVAAPPDSAPPAAAEGIEPPVTSESPALLPIFEEERAAEPASEAEPPAVTRPEETAEEIPATPDISSESTQQIGVLDLTAELERMAAIGFETGPPSEPATAPAAPQDEAPPVLPSQAEETTSPLAAESTETSLTPPESPAEALLPDLEESRIEVEFYLENEFLDEAWRAVAALEQKYPGNPVVAELRQRLNERPSERPAGETPSAETPASAEPVEEETAGLPESEFAVEDAADEWLTKTAESELQIPLLPPAEVEAGEQETGEQPTPAEVVSPPEPAKAEEPKVTEPPVPEAIAPAPEPAKAESVLPVEVEPPAPPPATDLPGLLPAAETLGEEPAIPESFGIGMLGDLAGDFAATLEGLAVPADAPPPAQAAPPAPAPGSAAGGANGPAQLSGLLSELNELDGAVMPVAEHDPETHYNLGVAFREMGLLDEAIGEFQKVVRITEKGTFPPTFIQSCSLLAVCFMDKQMPAIAVKWYTRALAVPGLDEQARLALQYDLGLAYERAGDCRHALESFTEVYSQDIDFRDVAEKVRELQNKA